MDGSPIFLHNAVQFHDLDAMINTDYLPPLSSHDESSPLANAGDDETAVVSISTTFSFTTQHRPHPPDIVLFSEDSVYFSVHSDVLLSATNNGFRDMLPIRCGNPFDAQSVLPVPEPSSVLNIILHAIYDIPCAQYSPSFETLAHAVDSMQVYGINPKSSILPSSPLFTLLLSHAPHFPLQLYALAAHHDIAALAVPTSSHLLSFPLSRMPDAMAQRMGATYLKRLIFLHLGRSEALKRVLGPLPDQHPPSPACGFAAQRQLSRAWALATASLAWDIRPDMSTHTLEASLRPLADHLSCEQCTAALNDCITHLIVQWAAVKRTIPRLLYANCAAPQNGRLWECGDVALAAACFGIGMSFRFSTKSIYEICCK
ncbi:hypothetical protein C8R47DRAFT_1187104 [Mycena vitilis]|nr:hypothetical protein C8R47DRAFT_1187104 [Mycena vitilis]